MQWYYSNNGSQLGPVEESEIRGKLASGEIAPGDLLWRDGMRDWLPAAQIPALASPPMSAAAAIPQVTRDDTFNSPYNPPAARRESVSYGPNFPNYLWQSIVVTILCCWPFGIPAIVYAAKVDGLKSRGDIAGAMAASNSAKTWCMVSAGLWLAGAVIGLLMFFARAMVR